MTARRPPSLRDPENYGQRLANGLRTFGVGSDGGRVLQAAPAAPLADSSATEVTDGSDISGGTSLTFTEDAFTVATSSVFALSYVPVAGSVNVYLNGMRLGVTADYTLSSYVVTVTITLSAGDDLRVWYVTDGTTPTVYSASLIGSGVASNGSFATSQTVTVSGTVAVGDFLIAFARGSGTTPTPPSGWTLVRDDVNTAGYGHAVVYYRVATSADVSSHAYTWSGPTDNWTVATLGYRGPTSVYASAGTIDQGGGTSTTAPSLTAPAGGGLLIASFSYNYNGFGPTGSPRYTTATGMTARTQANGNGWIVSEQQEQIVPAAATGTRTASTSPTSGPNNIGQAVLLV